MPTGLSKLKTHNDLFDENIDFAMRIAKRFIRYLPYGIRKRESDALENAALVGLWQSIQKFDVESMGAFVSFTEFRIRGSMIDYLREVSSDDKRNRIISRDIKSETIQPERQFETNEYLNCLLGKISARERMIVVMHGLQHMTMKSIGDQLGLSESSICIIWNSSIKKLRFYTS